MLQAKQKALQVMSEQIQEALDRVTQDSSGQSGQVSQEASEHMQEASEAMNQVAEDLGRMQASARAVEPSQHKMSEAMLEKILNELSQAQQNMDSALAQSELDHQLNQAEQLADQLMQDLESMNESSNSVDAEDMKQRLADAERLLDNLAQARPSEVTGNSRKPVSVNALTLTEHQSTRLQGPARDMIKRLWTVIHALNTSHGQAQDTPGSVSDFWDSENAFFERASQYRERRAEP